MKKSIRQRLYPCFLAVIVVVVFFLLPSADVQAEGFRLIGYLPDYDLARLEDTVDLEMFTDVNYFSLIPEPDGTLSFSESGSEEQLHGLVKEAHNSNVRVGVSIGGWGLSENFAEATKADNQEKFIEEILSFVKKFDIDNVDIDWEYPSEEQAEQFALFIKKLNKKLADSATLSITVPTGIAANGQPSGHWGQHFLPEGLKEADWINIMSYDAQIDGYPQHSPLELHEQNLLYWNELLGGNHMNKLAAGIPFYGKAESGAVYSYRDIVQKVAEVPMADEVAIDGEIFYFNNKLTVKEKTLASIELGSLGLMIWTPTLDRTISSPSRLMDVVMETIREEAVTLDKSTDLSSVFSGHSLTILEKLFSVIAVLLIILGVVLFLGKFLFLLPKTIKGRKVNPQALGKAVGMGIGMLGILLLLYLLLPVTIFLLLVSLLLIVLLVLLIMLKKS
ncbi:glycoside hydrolase family 18 protein [Vagococcus elongatus]|uniref:GH18 domain-containing protein n=1 Tax=Vagococcus elongatus TaxID=180344 RepID=A0A430B1C7_9ENTE|nr:glycoside hydrolase family 18 protein [Vagococcus elongatus]RSU14051.1 hypothetical protein CBF29_03980 [Vagococcus elongatus]